MRTLGLLGLAGCVAVAHDTVVEARGGGAGYWPPDSPTAVIGAIDLGFAGLELDVAPTADGVAVLWPSDALGPGCVDGEWPVDRHVRISTLSWAALSQIHCGGAPDPRFPNALVVSEPLMLLAEALEALRAEGQADQRVHLHVRAAPLDGPGGWPERVMAAWLDADPPQPLVLSSESPLLLGDLQAAAHRAGFEVPTVLRLQPESPDQEPTSPERPLDQAEAIGADGIGIDWRVLNRDLVDRARRRGLRVVTWTVDDPRQLARAAQWGLFGVLSDYPGDLPDGQPHSQP